MCIYCVRYYKSYLLFTMPRKKVKKELQYDDISSVSGESELDNLSIKEHELVGLTELCKTSNFRTWKTPFWEISTIVGEARANWIEKRTQTIKPNARTVRAQAFGGERALLEWGGEPLLQITECVLFSIFFKKIPLLFSRKGETVGKTRFGENPLVTYDVIQHDEQWTVH